MEGGAQRRLTMKEKHKNTSFFFVATKEECMCEECVTVMTLTNSVCVCFLCCISPRQQAVERLKVPSVRGLHDGDHLTSLACARLGSRKAIDVFLCPNQAIMRGAVPKQGVGIVCTHPTPYPATKAGDSSRTSERACFNGASGSHTHTHRDGAEGGRPTKVSRVCARGEENLWARTRQNFLSITRMLSN